MLALNMDMQFVLMIIIFACAVFYIGRLAYKAIIPKKGGCSAKCNKCDIDFVKNTKNKT